MDLTATRLNEGATWRKMTRGDVPQPALDRTHFAGTRSAQERCVVGKHEPDQQRALYQAVEFRGVDATKVRRASTGPQELAQPRMHRSEWPIDEILFEGAAGRELHVVHAATWGCKINQRQPHIGRMRDHQLDQRVERSAQGRYRVQLRPQLELGGQQRDEAAGYLDQYVVTTFVVFVDRRDLHAERAGDVLQRKTVHTLDGDQAFGLVEDPLAGRYRHAARVVRRHR